MANAGGRTCLAQKAKSRRFITQIPFANDLQRHRASEIDVERFESDPHRTATQFERFPVFARHQLVVLKSIRWLVQRRLNCFLKITLPGLSATSKTLAGHSTPDTEFHRSGKLIAAARADALGLRFHGSDRPSSAI